MNPYPFQLLLHTIVGELFDLLTNTNPAPPVLDLANALFLPQQCIQVLSIRAACGKCSWPLCSTTFSSAVAHPQDTLLAVLPPHVCDSTLILHCKRQCRKNSVLWFRSTITQLPVVLRPEARLAFQHITGLKAPFPQDITQLLNFSPITLDPSHRKRFAISPLFPNATDPSTLPQMPTSESFCAFTQDDKLRYTTMLRGRFATASNPQLDNHIGEFPPSFWAIPAIPSDLPKFHHDLSEIELELVHTLFQAQFQHLADFIVGQFNRPMTRFEYHVNSPSEQPQSQLKPSTTHTMTASGDEQSVKMDYLLAHRPIIENRRSNQTPSAPKRVAAFADTSKVHIFSDEDAINTGNSITPRPLRSALKPSPSSFNPPLDQSSAPIPEQEPPQSNPQPQNHHLQIKFPGVIKATPHQPEPLPPPTSHQQAKDYYAQPFHLFKKALMQQKPQQPQPSRSETSSQLTPHHLQEPHLKELSPAERLRKVRSTLQTLARTTMIRFHVFQHTLTTYSTCRPDSMAVFPFARLILNLPIYSSILSAQSLQLFPSQISLAPSTRHAPPVTIDQDVTNPRNCPRILKTRNTKLIRAAIRHFGYPPSIRLRLAQLIYSLFPNRSIVSLYLIFNTTFSPRLVTDGVPQSSPYGRDPPSYQISPHCPWFTATNPLQHRLSKSSPLYQYQNLINRDKSRFTLGAFLRLVRGTRLHYRLLEPTWVPQKVRMKPLGSIALYQSRVYDPNLDEHFSVMDQRYHQQSWRFPISPLPTTRLPVRGINILDLPTPSLDQLQQRKSQGSLSLLHEPKLAQYQRRSNFEQHYSFHVNPVDSPEQFPTTTSNKTRTKRVTFDQFEYIPDSASMLRKPLAHRKSLNYLQYLLLTPRDQLLHCNLAAFCIASILEPKIEHCIRVKAARHPDIHIDLPHPNPFQQLHLPCLQQELLATPLDEIEQLHFLHYFQQQQQQQQQQLLSLARFNSIIQTWTSLRYQQFLVEFNTLVSASIDLQRDIEQRINFSPPLDLVFNPPSEIAHQHIYHRVPGVHLFYPFYPLPPPKHQSLLPSNFLDAVSYYPHHGNSLVTAEYPMTIIDRPELFWPPNDNKNNDNNASISTQPLDSNSHAFTIDHALYGYSISKFNRLRPFIYPMLKEGIPIADQKEHLDQLDQSLLKGYTYSELDARFTQLCRSNIAVRNTTVRPNAGHGAFSKEIRSKGDTVGSAANALNTAPKIEVFSNQPQTSTTTLTAYPALSSNLALYPEAPRSRIYVSQNQSSLNSDQSPSSTQSRVHPPRRREKQTIQGDDFFQRPKTLIPFDGELEQKRLLRIQQREAKQRQPLDPDPEDYDYELGYFQLARELAANQPTETDEGQSPPLDSTVVPEPPSNSSQSD